MKLNKISLSDKHKKFIKYFIATILFSLAIYSVILTNELTNTYDGLWCGSYRQAGYWEISIGRVLWCFLDVTHCGIAAEPANILTSLAIFSAGVQLVFSIFDVPDCKRRYLASALMICNTTILVWLSYRYMTMTFATAFFFSILGVWYLKRTYKDKFNIKYLILATLSFMAALALYQADIGCSTLLIALLLLELLMSEKGIKKAVRFLTTSLCSLICACAFYKILWDLVLRLLNIQAASYKGANTLSAAGIIKAIPSRVDFAYKSFFNYFLNNDMKFNVYQRYPVFFRTILILSAVCIIVYFIIACRRCLLSVAEGKDSIIAMIFSTLIILFIPVLSNSALILAPESDMMIQMTMGMSMLFPLSLALSTKVDCGKKNFELVYIAIFAIVLYGNMLMVSVDQHTMRQGREETLFLFSRIETYLDSIDDITDKSVVFAGTPSNNPMFYHDKLWELSNDYSKYGLFWQNGVGITQSYSGLLRDTGLNLKLETDMDYYHKLIDSSEVKAMPVYPAKDSIKEIDGRIVVKISDQ